MISLRNLPPPHNHLLQLTLRPGFSSYAVLPHNSTSCTPRARLSLSPRDLGAFTQFHRMEMDPHSSDTEVMKPTSLGPGLITWAGLRVVFGTESQIKVDDFFFLKRQQLGGEAAADAAHKLAPPNEFALADHSWKRAQLFFLVLWNYRAIKIHHSRPAALASSPGIMASCQLVCGFTLRRGGAAGK